MEPFFPIFNPENNGKVSTEKEVFSRESADEGISCSDLRVAFINERPNYIALYWEKIQIKINSVCC